MKKYLKGLIMVACAIALVIIGLVLKNTDYAGYSVL